jgi:succinate dehydrogenase / fumarate reductase, cytochrome b subunit
MTATPGFDEEADMANNSSLIETAPVTTTRTLANHPVIVFWHTMIGKKVVMAVTGVVLILFVIAHMLGNLKIFSGQEDINAYSRFLREVGTPELAYGELLWVVRITLLACVMLHITGRSSLVE